MKNELKTRKNLRLSNYNYSKNGYYFITICAKNKECIFSQINNKNTTIQLSLSKYGKIIDYYLNSINTIYNNLQITNYIIMPNHIHFICELTKQDTKSITRANEKIPFIISTLKRLTNKKSKINLWQRNYYEHIIRNEKEYLNIIQYIENNPYQWQNDTYYCS